ncbi:MAG: iron-containing alcohol dehydrogenase [Bacteroidetes bacterium]|jgi:butanol dehydrogenase|nr:iron-containing alcohol dehydrogenase [Bacteroidota bacterium]MBT5529374.1 iron-containing alcohol dehydrogenase [Cytophagia bacterium]MBT5989329.1 iron-containing alcohol dehydrogenase [Bacteroidota bacterium]
MLNFDFNIPTKIYFGQGRIEVLGKEILKYGKKILLAYGGGSIKKNGIYDDVVSQLKSNKIEFVELCGIKPNPSIESVREGVKLCRENEVEFILAVGGGSVIDCAKAIAAGVNYAGDAWDFFVKGAKVNNVIAIGSILTLSATGSEMNANTVISNEATEEKLPFAHPTLKPRFSILDPTYTYSVSAVQTAAGTADIMSHCLEQYFSKVDGTFVQDRMTEAILKTCIQYGPIAMKEPDNYEARANLMWASSLALNGLLQYGKEGDWATHVMEHKISAISDLTHGIGLAILTPHWMAEVLDKSSLEKFHSFATNVFHISEGNDQMEMANAGIQALKEFFISLNIPSNLYDLGIRITEDRFHEMAVDIVKNGPIGKYKSLGLSEVLSILKSCYR